MSVADQFYSELPRFPREEVDDISDLVAMRNLRQQESGIVGFGGWLFVVAIGVVCGAIGWLAGVHLTRLDAASVNAGEWRVNHKSGRTEFVWTGQNIFR